MSNKINKLRKKMNKPHDVLNRNPNFPVIYYCIGDRFAYLFDQEGGYDYNFEVAGDTDFYGAEKAIAIEKDMLHQDDLMNEGKIPYTPNTFSEIQMNAVPKRHPDNTDTFNFFSKNEPYDIMNGYYSNWMTNLADGQDSTVSAIIRAHNFEETLSIFEKIKNYSVDYVAKQGLWKTRQREGHPIDMNKLFKS